MRSHDIQLSGTILVDTHVTHGNRVNGPSKKFPFFINVLMFHKHKNRRYASADHQHMHGAFPHIKGVNGKILRKKCYLQYVTKTVEALSIPSPIDPTGMTVTMYRVYGSRPVSLIDCVEFPVLVLLTILVIFSPYLPYFIL